MTESVILVTGTSSGIGLEVAVQAARAGHTVVATMRNLDRDKALRDAAAAASVDLDIRRLDVTDEASITGCIDGIIADHGRLDGVVNNAGTGHVGTIEQESISDVREVMEVNFFGVVQVTRAALPHLRASSGRLITVSSVGGLVGQPFNEAYCAAKFAVEGFMESLTSVAATVGVRVSVIEPGAVTSEFIANAGVDPEALAETVGPYRSAMDAYLTRTAAAFDPSSTTSSAQSPIQAASVIVDVLGDDAPAARVQTSDWARSFAGTKIADLDGSAVQGLMRGWVS